MKLPPIEVIVSWPSPDYENPEVRGQALVVLSIIFIILVLLACLGRFYSRLVLKKWFGLDDAMITLALLFTIGMTIVVILANRAYGWNRHLWDVPMQMFEGASIIAFVAKLMFTLASTFTRLSLLCFYYRLVKDAGIVWFAWVLHCSVAFTVALCVIFIAQIIWLCVPVQAYWTFPAIADAKCLDEGRVMLVAGILNCFADLLTTMLPIPIVMRLQMPLKQRLGVCVLLCLGVMVTIAGILRTYFIWKGLVDSYDATWYTYPLWICATVEIDVAVICACAPSWKAILHKHFHQVTDLLSSLRSPYTSKRTKFSSALTTIDKASTAVKLNPCRTFFKAQISNLCETIGKNGQFSELEKGMLSPESSGTGVRQDNGSQNAIMDARRESRLSSDRLPSRILTTSQPSLQIFRRQSIEQESLHLNVVDSSQRRSVAGLVPGQWLCEPSSKR